VTEPAPPAGSAPRILVVEDLFHVAELLEDMLRGLGYRVVGPVPRLGEAVRLAREAQLEGALLDVNLDGDDASPVAETLAARGIPFVFVTGYDRLDTLPAQFRDRPRLKKPFALAQLRRALDDALAPRPAG
jgi:two-component system, chemotaxis family, sensor kinase Cph1